MDRLDKSLTKLSGKERGWAKELLEKIKSGDLENLDLKKLKGRDDVFRVRKGQIRIIYQAIKNQEIKILTIERRGDNTYSDF
ncbi:MAG: hypothetical protein AAB589_00550 [Patescibacteria group bacterium]